MTGEPRSYNQILYSYIFIKKNCVTYLRVVRPVLLLLVHFWVCPSQVLLQTYLSIGGECDGHVYSTWAGVVDWATVYCIVIVDVDTRAIHRSCLRHRSIYSTFGGKAVC